MPANLMMFYNEKCTVDAANIGGNVVIASKLLAIIIFSSLAFVGNACLCVCGCVLQFEHKFHNASGAFAAIELMEFAFYAQQRRQPAAVYQPVALVPRTDRRVSQTMPFRLVYGVETEFCVYCLKKK